jgi:carbon storage regulator CsrA
MLVISRKTFEAVRIDGKTTVIVNEIKGNTVSLAFDAPRDVRIVRTELLTSKEHATQWERE